MVLAKPATSERPSQNCNESASAPVACRKRERLHNATGRLSDERMNGPRFDRTYGRMQVQAHQMAIASHQAYLQSGPNPALRTYVQQVLPSMQEHLAMAQRLPGAR